MAFRFAFCILPSSFCSKVLWNGPHLQAFVVLFFVSEPSDILQRSFVSSGLIIPDQEPVNTLTKHRQRNIEFRAMENRLFLWHIMGTWQQPIGGSSEPWFPDLQREEEKKRLISKLPVNEAYKR